jgi:dolichyl-phosphate beta-glucosyltransferase
MANPHGHEAGRAGRATGAENGSGHPSVTSRAFPSGSAGSEPAARLTRAIVVPCFDESERLDSAGFLRLADEAQVVLVFVDDGSADDTALVLDRLRVGNPDRIRVLTFDHNRGKGEAVRAGLRYALRSGADVVGYYDADMATPTHELPRLFEALDRNPDVAAVIAARVRMLGYQVHRSQSRQLLSRAFATVARFGLAMPVYDTQCGAKIFRRTPTLAAALSEPFSSRWAFDVEFLRRLSLGSAGVDGLPASAFLEVPLREWNHVGGSKLGHADAFHAGIDLVSFACRARLARRRLHRTSRVRGPANSVLDLTDDSVVGTPEPPRSVDLVLFESAPQLIDLAEDEPWNGRFRHAEALGGHELAGDSSAEAS